MNIRFFLKWGTPALSVLILLYCTWIYFCPFAIALMHGNLGFMKLVKGLVDSRDNYIQMYIFIKGIFCSAMLYIVGNYFLKQLDK